MKLQGFNLLEVILVGALRMRLWGISTNHGKTILVVLVFQLLAACGNPNDNIALDKKELPVFSNGNIPKTMLPQEVRYHLTNEDTMLRVDSVTSLFVLHNTFLYEDNNEICPEVILKITPANTLYHRLVLGLSTRSNGKILHSQSMFHLDVEAPNGRPIKINKSAGIVVSTGVDGAGYKLFTGEGTTKDHSMNWLPADTSTLINLFPISVEQTVLTWRPNYRWVQGVDLWRPNGREQLERLGFAERKLDSILINSKLEHNFITSLFRMNKAMAVGVIGNAGWQNIDRLLKQGDLSEQKVAISVKNYNHLEALNVNLVSSDNNTILSCVGTGKARGDYTLEPNKNGMVLLPKDVKFTILAIEFMGEMVNFGAAKFTSSSSNVIELHTYPASELQELIRKWVN